MIQIETKVTIKEWETLGKVIYPARSIYFAHALTAICLFFAYRYYAAGRTGLIAYYIVLPLVIEFVAIRSRSTRMKSHIQYFKDTFPDGEVTLEYQFGDQKFSIRNRTTGEKTDYDYEIPAEIRESEEYMVILGYGRQYFIFDKQAADEKHLKEFLLEKNPEIKTGKKL